MPLHAKNANIHYMKNWYFAILFLFLLLFFSYQLCQTNPGTTYKRKFFCSYPEIYAGFYLLVFAAYMYRMR